MHFISLQLVHKLYPHRVCPRANRIAPPMSQSKRSNQPATTHYCNCTMHAFQVSATWIHEYSNAVGNKYEFKGNLYAFAKSDRKSDDRNSQIEDTIDGGYYHHQSITIYCRYRGQREEDALQITRR